MVELKVYKIGQFAVMVNMTVRQLQELDRNGTLPAKRTVTGRRYYTDSDIEKYLNLLI